jgi:predicted transcriptional regulator
MKAVLISIQPKWVEKIASVEKTIEVRKTKPNLKTPFKCYIYETKAKQIERLDGCDITYYGRGKVIGEFVCDRIDRIGKRGINNNFDYCYLSLNEWGNDDIEIEITDIHKSCISKSELNAYGANSSCLYAWHINDLKIYDKPKELSEFRKPCDRFLDCITCKRLVINDFLSCDNKIARPPQSWCYVEELI